MKLFRLIPIILMAWNAFASEPGDYPDPQRPQPPAVQQPGPAVEQAPCVQDCYDPRANYYCEMGCPDPEPPFAPPVDAPPGVPVIVRPRLQPYGYAPYYRRRPHHPHGGYVRRMSMSAGCEVQQGNNGEFAVLSTTGLVLYLDDSAHAFENASYMKDYYEKTASFGLCSIQRSAWDI